LSGFETWSANEACEKLNAYITAEIGNRQSTIEKSTLAKDADPWLPGASFLELHKLGNPQLKSPRLAKDAHRDYHRKELMRKGRDNPTVLA